MVAEGMNSLMTIGNTNNGSVPKDSTQDSHNLPDGRKESLRSLRVGNVLLQDQIANISWSSCHGSGVNEPD